MKAGNAGRRLQPQSARPLGRLGATPLDLTPYPCAVLNRVGKAQVAYVPWDVFRYFRETRYPEVREWIGELVAALGPDLELRVQAPSLRGAAPGGSRPGGRRHPAGWPGGNRDARGGAAPEGQPRRR